jgi:homoserine kinase type II
MSLHTPQPLITPIPTIASEALPPISELPFSEYSQGYRSLPAAHMKEPLPSPADGAVNMARHELATVLRYWGYRPEMWRIVGFTTSAADPLLAASSAAEDAHPIVEVMQTPVVVRRQSMSLLERHTMARHAFMRYLAARGLPVPALLERPDGSTYALVPVVPLTDPQQAMGITYVIENAIYEIQAYVAGRRYVTDGPGDDIYLQAAAQTLADLHVASLDYPGSLRHWPRERTLPDMSWAYLERIAEAGQGEGLSRSIASGLRRLARASARWAAVAAARLDAHPDLPWLYVHGDYQPHNLAFAGDRVCAIYDFEAMHWDRRVLGLAYALLAFAGLRWDDDSASGAPSTTPPLVEQGLDLERARAFLTTYGQIAPPRPGEADVLGDALLVVLPILFANGVAEDLVFIDRDPHPIHPPRECRAHLEWAETFPAWIEAHRALLRDAWQSTGARS